MPKCCFFANILAFNQKIFLLEKSIVTNLFVFDTLHKILEKLKTVNKNKAVAFYNCIQVCFVEYST